MLEAQDEDLRQEEEERRRQREEDQNIQNIQNEIYKSASDLAAEGVKVGDEIAEYLRNILDDDDRLKRWRLAISKNFIVPNPTLDAVNKVIYEMLFPDHAVEGGKRIPDEATDDDWASTDDD